MPISVKKLMLVFSCEPDTIGPLLIIKSHWFIGRNESIHMLKNPTVRIILAVAVVVLIVATTFAYGNSQRQAQMKKKDEMAQQQRDAEASLTPSPSVTPTPSAGVSPTPSASPVISPPTGTTPDTGAGSLAVIPVVGIGILLYSRKQSREALLNALRK